MHPYRPPWGLLEAQPVQVACIGTGERGGVKPVQLMTIKAPRRSPFIVVGVVSARGFSMQQQVGLQAILGVVTVVVLMGLANAGYFDVRAAEEAAPAPSPEAKFYRVVDGKVDGGTRRGWEVFHRTCYVCHGVDATGTDIAPDLTQRVKGMTVTDFSNRVLNRYRIVAPMNDTQAEFNVIQREKMIREMQRHERGELGRLMMPAWEKDFRVRPHLIDLFAYLQARADGALGPGEPLLLEGEP